MFMYSEEEIGIMKTWVIQEEELFIIYFYSHVF